MPCTQFRFPFPYHSFRVYELGALNQRYLQLNMFVPMVITPQAPLPHVTSVGALGDVSKSVTMS